MTTVKTNTKELAKDLQVLLEEVLEVKTNNPTAKEIVDRFIDGIFERVANGETIKLGAYADLTPKVRAARKGRNPQTGEELEIAASNALGLKAHGKLKELLNHSKK